MRPDEVASEDRLTEIAAILAAAILRLRRRHALSSEHAQNPLEFAPDTVLTVHRG